MESEGEGEMDENYILPQCAKGLKLKNYYFSVQSGKPQLIAFLITDTKMNFVEV